MTVPRTCFFFGLVLFYFILFYFILFYFNSWGGYMRTARRRQYSGGIAFIFNCGSSKVKVTFLTFLGAKTRLTLH